MRYAADIRWTNWIVFTKQTGLKRVCEAQTHSAYHGQRRLVNAIKPVYISKYGYLYTKKHLDVRKNNSIMQRNLMQHLAARRNQAALPALMEENMKKLVVLVVMVMVSAWSTLAFAGQSKMIGTIQTIKMQGNAAEVTLKDRKSDEIHVLQVRDNSNLEKLKDKKIRVGDELRIRFDSDTKIISRVQKTAGC